MSEQQFQFRTAAFGGFQKQDVLNFVEVSAKEHAEREAQLLRELEEAKSAGEKVTELTEQVEKLTAERKQLQSELADRELDMAEVTAARDELRAQVAELRLRVEKMEPAVTAYEALKERTAGIELEAHGRAQIIEREARERAQKTQEKAGEWLAVLEVAYRRLRADLDATLSHAAGEMQRVEQGLAAVSGQLDVHDEALKALRRQMEADTPKVPDPLQVEPEGE